MLIVPETEGKTYFERLKTDSSLKMALGKSRDTTHYQNRISTTGKATICKEVFMTIPVVIYTRKDFYLLNSLDYWIEQLRASGLIDFRSSETFEREQSMSRALPPKVLKVKDFRGSFYIIAFGWIAGTIVLLSERAINKLRPN